MGVRGRIVGRAVTNSTRLDFSIWQGTNEPVIVWQADFDLAGSSFVLKVVDRFGATVFNLDSAVDEELVVDTDLRQIIWNYSIDDSNLVPLGKLLSYTLERHISDTEGVYADGKITGKTAGSGEVDQTFALTTPGPRGPKGDVTPEALAAQAAAEEARDEAITQAGNAADDADRAEEALAAAIAQTIYETTAAGLAASSEGEYFWVVDSDDDSVAALYREVSGAAVDTGKRLPSQAAIATMADTVISLSQIEGLSIETAKLTEGSGSVSPTCFDGYAFANATAYEHVVVAKAAERSLLQLISASVGAGYTVNFDLLSGTFSSSGTNLTSVEMTHLGSGWYECKANILTTASVSSNVQARISAAGVFPYTGDGSSGLYVRTIELREQGSDTNLLPSNDPTNAAFTKSGVTASNTATAEDRVLPAVQTLLDSIDITVNGRLTGDKVIEPSGSGSPSVFRARSFTSGDTFEFEVIAKRAERTRLNLFSNTAAVFNCTFDLENGTCSGSGASIVHLGNGWYECTVVGTAGATGSTNLQHRVFGASGGHPYTGDGSSGLYLQQSTLKINGGDNVFPQPTDFSSSSWTKSSGVTISSNVALFLGALSEGSAVAQYDDGRSALVGKKWAALGTSITAQGQYTSALASSSGMVLTNLGVSGGEIGGTTPEIYDAVASISSDTEIVTIEAGINDFGDDATTLGALGDTTTATFYGALYATVVAIRSQAPDAKIVFFTPYSGGISHATHRHGITNGKGNTLVQFQRAVEEVAKYTAYPAIDVGQRAGIGLFTAADYMSDDLHINAPGGARYAAFALDGLRELSRAGFFNA